MEVTFILQNIAANLGGMLTPFGNPQNLYLYSFFKIDTFEFVGIMAPCFSLAIVLITLCCIIFIKPEKVILQKQRVNLPPAKTVIYLLLFAFSIAIVFRGIPYYFGLIIIPAFLLFMDRNALKSVDYPLLLTFVFFFVFAGNIEKHPYFFGAVLSSDKQCAVGGIAFTVYRKLCRFTGGCKHRRGGYAYRISCKPYHLPRICFPQPDKI